MPPTTTHTPAPTPTPIAESWSDGLRITFLQNAGFLITYGDRRILIDVLYEGYEGGVLKPVLDSVPPFDGVELILATHDHRDHFSPDLVLRYMEANPQAVFISTQSAVEQLVALDSGIRGRTFPIELQKGESQQLEMGGFTLEAIYISHGIWGYLNLGFIMEIGDVSLLHTGDMDPDSVKVSELQAYGLPQRQLDVALVPDFLLTMEEFHAHVLEGIQARYVIPMHFSLQDPPLISETDFSNAFIFRETYQSWVLPSKD
jgi:L-ascorbate metabolism protein UlaG (beta-lactamase superfamily)